MNFFTKNSDLKYFFFFLFRGGGGGVRWGQEQVK